MKVLAIDTSGKIASISICDEKSVLAEVTIVTKLTHSQVIMPLLKKLLSDAEIQLQDIDVFAVANGPGSYTGLRIGVSAIKSLAYALDKQCIGVSTLKSLAYNFLGIDSKICSVMFARANLVYCAFFDSKDGEISRVSADEIVEIEFLKEKLLEYNENIFLVGDYSENIFSLLDKDNIKLAPIRLRQQSASSICTVALNEKSFYSPEVLDVNYLQITKAEQDLISK